jgi:hypothetical protein
MCLIFYLTQLRLIFYLDYANGFFGDLVDSFNPLNVKTCSDLISDEENDNFVLMIIIIFILICLYFFLYLLNFEKRDTPQGCANIDGKCRGIVFDCSLMKNETMCERNLNYRKCIWNYSSETCTDF